MITTAPLRALAASLLVVLAAAIAVAGCGSGDDDGDAPAGGAPAADTTTAPGAPGKATPPDAPSDKAKLSDKEQVAALLDELQATYVAGDAERYCSLLTKRGQKLVVAFARFLKRDQTCVEFVAQTSQMTKEAGIVQKPTKLIKVRIRGDEAIATVRDGGRPPQPMRFVRVDGDWKLPDPGFMQALAPKKGADQTPPVPPPPGSAG